MYIKFLELFKTAFNQDILINRGIASKIPLYVGKAPIIDTHSSEDRASLSYVRRLIELPTLEEQGDGMRGFVGVLLSVLVASQSLLMIDEPEAFLHPPQARLLGKFIGREISNSKQIIIATHSEDIIKGLIDVASQRLKIIRLRRKSDLSQYYQSIIHQEINHVSELNNSSIKELWNDPILRYSNILSGLFHSKVILCEGDADCRFYSAINDILLDDKVNNSEKNNSDLLFVHCNGKGKMYIIVNALKKLDVPISVAVDIYTP